MPLKALTEYFELLVNDAKAGVPGDGYSIVNVSYEIVIDLNGELTGLVPLFDTVSDGKKERTVPKKVILPMAEIRSSGIRPNFLWDASAYTLGLSNKDDPEAKGKKGSYSLDRYNAFVEHQNEVMGEVSSPAANALRAFFTKFDPTAPRQYPVIARDLENVLAATGFFIFKIGPLGLYAHQDPDLRSAWMQYYHRFDETAEQGQCLITGEQGPLERIHPKIKGVRDAQSTGASLVGFNLDSSESYGKKQGENAPISRKAVFAYTTALNYLIASREPKRSFIIGDTTVVFWSDNPSPIYADIFSNMFLSDDNFDPVSEQPDEQAEQMDGQMTLLAEESLETPEPERVIGDDAIAIRIARNIKQGLPIDTAMDDDGLDSDTRFFVLGLAPNSARISIRFFYKDRFTSMLEKISRHYEDTRLTLANGEPSRPIPLWKLENETVSQKSKDKKASPLLAGALMRAILNDLPYPAIHFNSIITRVRADMDDEKNRITKINTNRAAIIKAYLLRKIHRQADHPYMEVLQMSLNESSTNKAYIMGRLFAILEKAQQNASGGNLNATIKDRYFTNACAAPATVFPVLLRLSQHHISKDDQWGWATEKKIEQVMSLLNVEDEPFPRQLSLDEQGIFILGYYHQREDFYKKKSTGPSAVEENIEKQLFSEE